MCPPGRPEGCEGGVQRPEADLQRWPGHQAGVRGQLQDDVGVVSDRRPVVSWDVRLWR